MAASLSLTPVFLFQVPPIEQNLLDDKHLLKPWDAKKVSVSPSLPWAWFSGSQVFNFHILGSPALLIFLPTSFL